MFLPFAVSAYQRVETTITHLAGRVSGRKRLQQSGALSLWSLAEQAIPVRESVSQFATPGPQFTQASFEGEQLFRSQATYAAAGRAPTGAFAEDGGELIDREADR